MTGTQSQLDRAFVVRSITREDLASTLANADGIEPDWPRALSDTQMEAIAASLSEAIGENDYWYVLGLVVDRLGIAPHVCDMCGRTLTEGYVCCGESFCSRDCLDKSFKDGQTWEDHYREDGDCYWTTWEELAA